MSASTGITTSDTASLTAAPLTLNDAFTQAFTSLRAYQHADSASSTPPPSAAVALSHMLALHSMLAHSDALSLNESTQELPASSLRFVPVSYELGSLWQDQPGIEGRRKRLDMAILAFFAFLSLCDHLDALTESDRRAYLALKDKFASDGDTALASQVRRSDPTQQRADKIAKFKQNRELQTKLAAIEDKFGVALLDAPSDEDDSDDREDQLRDYWISRIQLGVNKALESIPLCVQEQEFLVERERREAEEQRNPERAQQQIAAAAPATPHRPLTYTIGDPSQLNQPIPDHMKQYLFPLHPPTSTDAGVTQSAPHSQVRTHTTATSPFNMSSIVTTLDNLTARPSRETVFRQSNAATISVEEWADQEIAAGRMPGPQQPVRMNERRGYVGQARNERPRSDSEDASELVGQLGGESDRRAEEQKALEARAWDNWKDDHEKGAGNRKFR